MSQRSSPLRDKIDLYSQQVQTRNMQANQKSNTGIASNLALHSIREKDPASGAQIHRLRVLSNPMRAGGADRVGESLLAQTGRSGDGSRRRGGRAGRPPGLLASRDAALLGRAGARKGKEFVSPAENVKSPLSPLKRKQTLNCIRPKRPKLTKEQAELLKHQDDFLKYQLKRMVKIQIAHSYEELVKKQIIKSMQLQKRKTFFEKKLKSMRK